MNKTVRRISIGRMRSLLAATLVLALASAGCGSDVGSGAVTSDTVAPVSTVGTVPPSGPETVSPVDPLVPESTVNVDHAVTVASTSPVPVSDVRELVGRSFEVESDVTFDPTDVPRQLGLPPSFRNGGGTSFEDEQGWYGGMTKLVDERRPSYQLLMFSLLTPGSSVSMVTEIVEIDAAEGDYLSWERFGCSVKGQYDSAVIAMFASPKDSKSNTDAWPATQAWRYTRDGLEQVDPAGVTCQP
jgi:hypothetical protein